MNILKRIDVDTELYFIACEYMAKTELYDRTLTYDRAPWDKTSAFIHKPIHKKISNDYALSLRRYYTEYFNITWHSIKEEIHKHNYYTAQKWIDEYNRLKNDEAESEEE